jgi:apolipoprotein N-acyltransferase
MGTLTVLAYGGSVLANRPSPLSAPGLRIVALQGGSAPATDDLVAANAHTLDTYTDLTRAAADMADLVIWPEMTWRVLLRDNPGLRRHFDHLVTAIDRPLLLGALDSDDGGNGERNTVYLFAPERAGDAGSRPGEPARHHKRRLVPWK